MSAPVTVKKLPVIFIMGPTASGKTDLAIALRDHMPVELINVDSAQIYDQMDIGTAKPDIETLTRAPHRYWASVTPPNRTARQTLLKTPKKKFLRYINWVEFPSW